MILSADEKAKEIYNLFYSEQDDFPHEQATSHAIACVDQIIEEVKLIYNGSYPTYWDYVKEEINNL